MGSLWRTKLITILIITVLVFGGANTHGENPHLDDRVSLGARRASFFLDDVFARFTNNTDSIEIAANEIGARSFMANQFVDGSGVTIAIIDTGIDTAHPDLLKTTKGRRKIIDWVDFTDEGLVKTEISLRINDGKLQTPSGDYVPPTLQSRSGVFFYGIFNESQLDVNGYLEQDINRNGRNDDFFGVLVIDSRVPGFYDTVIIDTNGDMDFSNETPLNRFSETGEWDYFANPTNEEEKSSFVISHIARNGRSVNIGFDGNGHGTHVAGIAAANGHIQGIAPGAQIIALKALGSSGDGSWENIAKAINYAAQNGADIINISIDSMFLSKEGNSTQSRLIDKVSQERGILFVLAAGNDGPGLNTSTAFGDAEEALTVGAYISPEMWKTNYGETVKKAGLWYYSSAGPSFNGMIVPQVVAPGSAVSSVNIWDNDGYDLLDGTSMAAPHVSGAAALLIEKARSARMRVTPRILKRAFILGAQPIEGYQIPEQGFGLINVERTWSKIIELDGAVPNIHVAIYNRTLSEGKATFYRDGLKPGPTQYRFINMNISPSMNLILTGDNIARWDRNTLRLIRGTPRESLVYFDIPNEPGLYSGILYGNDKKTPNPDLLLPYTVVVPYQINPLQGLNIRDKAYGGSLKRYFINVDPGTEELSFDLVIDKGRDGNPLGKAKMMVFDSSGKQIINTDFVGMDYFSGISTTSHTIYQPSSGVWEVVVYSSATIGKKGLDSTSFSLRVNSGRFFLKERDAIININDTSQPVEVSIAVINGLQNLKAKVDAVGLWREGQNRLSNSYTIKHGQTFLSPRIEVGDGVYELRVTLDVDIGNDVDLYLYRIEGSDYIQMGTSAVPFSPREEITLRFPEKGKYIAYMFGYDIPLGETRGVFSYELYHDNRQVLVSTDVEQWNKGQEKALAITIFSPPDKGRYKGSIQITDSIDGAILAELPITVNVGLAEMDVQVLRGSGGHLVTITIKDKTSGKAIDGELIIDGERVFIEGGSVTIPLRGRKGLDIEITKDGYIPFRQVLSF